MRTMSSCVVHFLLSTGLGTPEDPTSMVWVVWVFWVFWVFWVVWVHWEDNRITNPTELREKWSIVVSGFWEFSQERGELEWFVKVGLCLQWLVSVSIKTIYFLCVSNYQTFISLNYRWSSSQNVFITHQINIFNEHSSQQPTNTHLN